VRAQRVRAIVVDFGGVLIDWNPRYLYRKLFRGNDTAMESFLDLIQAYDERWEESIAGPLQGTVDLLLPLQQAGLELHGLSNWSSEKFAAVRTKYAFFQLFATILLSGDVKLIKPDPRIFEALLERIGRSAGECLFIDDSEENISTARSLGFETIRFESPDQLRRELQHRGLLPR